jgi:acyl-CoA reductase-like NAD-dependent aldehyde dehydrogenase
MAVTAEPKHFGLLIDGEWLERPDGKVLEVRSPNNGEVFATLPEATQADLDAAIEAAQRAYDKQEIPPYQRYEILHKASQLLLERTEDIAFHMSMEGGKPIKEARIEVARAASTILVAAEEAKRIHGEQIPVEAAVGSESRLAFTMRQPIGVICCISPFNFPAILVAHKIAPAIAAGNTVVLKPASATPVTAAKICQAFLDAGLPAGHLNLLVGGGATLGEWLINDERFAMYSFTGSADVGKHLRNSIGLRRATLELGANSPVIVDQTADVAVAADAVAQGGYMNAGQVCTSAQRILVHRSIEEEFLAALVPLVEKMKVGPSYEDDTDVGPMVTLSAAERVEAWFKEAAADGATVHCGGEREDQFVTPAVVSGVRSDMRLFQDELFGPAVTVTVYDDIDEAIALANDSRYGLQGGIFTNDLETAWKAAKGVRIGALMINDTSRYRVDAMPFGGVKESGMGREGPKYVIEEMTDLKLVVFNLQG